MDLFIADINTLIAAFGVPGAISAAIAAALCFVVGLYFLGHLIRRTAELRRPEKQADQPDAPAEQPRLTAAVSRLAMPAVLTLIAFGIGLVLVADALVGLADYLQWIMATAFVIVIGGGVGAAELVSRYKDRPDKAVCTTPAVFYISLNALASVAALYLIYVYAPTLEFLDIKSGWSAAALVKAVLVAGFSSLLFFRTNLFKLRVGDTDLAVGPSIILDSLLAAADRAVDRVMAEPRAKFVHKIMQEVSFEKAAVILPAHCLALMQNVSSAESQRIAGVVNQLRADKEMPDKIKSLNLGLAILTVVGEEVLKTAVSFLQSDIQDTTTRLVQDVAEVMRSVSFDRARRMLPRYCMALWPKEISGEIQEKVKADTASLAELKDVPEGYKAIMLGIWLARLTDGATLRKAVKDLGLSIEMGRDDGDSTGRTDAEPKDAEAGGTKAQDPKPQDSQPEAATTFETQGPPGEAGHAAAGGTEAPPQGAARGGAAAGGEAEPSNC